MNAQSNGAPSLPDFVPVIIIGAGPAGITAATLLGQYGIECLVLDRHETVYPLPRAVHADDEIYRILARLGVSDEFAAHSRPGLGLRLIDPEMRVLTEIPRSTEPSADGFPQMNMFDQPELEAMLRANVKRYPHVKIHGNVEVTSVTQNQPDRVRVSFLDRVRGGEQSVQASYVLGCDGANSLTRASSGRTCTACRFPGLARDRRQHRRRTQPVGGLPPAVQSPACRHLHAGRPNPLPLGIPAGRRRNRSRLPDPGRRRVADQALAGRHSRRRIGAGARHRLHVPRAGGQPLARPQCVPPR